VKLKTFLTTYLLFIIILFGSLGFVSVYMNNNQMGMLRKQGERDFGRISSTLARDVAVLYGQMGFQHDELVESVEMLVRGYSHYYREHGIHLTISAQDTPISDEIIFVQSEHGYFIYITGTLPGAFHSFTLNFRQCITESVTVMQNIQRIFLMLAIGFSVIAAFAFYIVLSQLFKPLNVVAHTSIKIADGHYGERIYVKGNNELSQVARDFNRMAEKIENQILILKEEAAKQQRLIVMLEEEAIKKQQFIDNFAHEIRTPLTSIYGNAEHMQRALLDEDEIIELTEIIMERTNHMIKIANSLLQLATLRDYTPATCHIDVKALFANIAQTLSVHMAEHGVQLTFKSDVDVLQGQEDLLKSLLLNLCFNAMKACAIDSGEIILEAVRLNGKIVLSVTDNGCGIPKESLARVAEPFYRVDKARSRNQDGAGLGLTLCKQIAAVHGAKMNIESTEGVGTSIKVEFTNP